MIVGRIMRYDQSHAVTDRHEVLLNFISSGSYSSPILAKKLGVSEPTVYRDIQFLKRQGYSIKSVRLSDHWAYQIAASQKVNSQRKEGGQK